MSNPITIRKRGVVAVVARGDRLLVIQRSQHVRAPGMYCFPGGGIEPGESEDIAVAREMHEELAATVAPVRCLWRYVTSWGVDLAWWLVTLPEDAALVHNPLEVEAFHWMHPREIRGLEKLLESNLHFLDAVEAGEIIVDGLELS